VTNLFDGLTFDPALDLERLESQLGRVYRCLKGGRWFTLSELQTAVGGSEAGISARLRDLRKTKFGGHQVLRRRRGDPAKGLWEYRLNGDT
jgi:hypothetical protein